MKKFQIRLVDRHGHGSCLYFQARVNTNLAKKACETANEHLRRRQERDQLLGGFLFRSVCKPIRSLKVVEHDSTTHKAVRGGIKFTIRLTFIEVKFASGERNRNEWYVCDEKIKTNQNGTNKKRTNNRSKQRSHHKGN